jgi:hypothetical protein
MKPSFALLLATALVLLLAVPVSATPPVVQTGSGDIDYVAFDSEPCPGIVIRDHEVYTYTITSFFDNQGNLVRTQIHAIGTDNLYNPLNPDVVLSGHFVHNFLIDERTGEQTDFGVPYHITVPGYGTVLVEAGRWFPDGRSVGKHSFGDPKDLEQFCSLLAGD